MKLSSLLVLTFILAGVAVGIAAEKRAPQSRLDPSRAEATKKYPRIVLFSVSWCPHCRETKDYFTHNNIPFINRDVEVDPKAMEELTGRYNSTGVPVIVFGTGKNELVMQGFTPELFQENLKKAQVKK